MSRHATFNYRLERQRLAEERVRERTTTFLDEYQDLLDDMHAQGLDQYDPKTYRKLIAAVADVRAVLDSDPFAARSQSIELGAKVHAFPRSARALRARVQASESRERSQRHPVEHGSRHDDEPAAAAMTPDLDATWQEEMAAWADRLATQIAGPEIKRIRDQYFAGGQSANPDGLRKDLARLRQASEAKADEVRREELADAERHILEETVTAKREEVLASTSLKEPQRARLLHSLTTDRGGSATDAATALIEVSEVMDDAETAELSRREAVRSVLEALESAGFVTEPPRRFRHDESDEVVIHGRRPGGATAEFKLGLDEKLEYRFDGYAGAGCKRDIDAIIPKLQDVYGIRLSDHSILWENPDDIDSQAKPQPHRTAGN